MNGIELIKSQIIPLVQLVASTSLWASPIVVQRLLEEENNLTSSWYDNSKRFRNHDGEKIGTFKEGLYLDNNSKANYAIKAALVFKEKLKDFATCHIYDESAYDSKYYTSIPNLVLVPRPIYSLTDHLMECKEFLKYYSFIKYHFYIKNEPTKPPFWDEICLDNIIIPTSAQEKRALKSIERRTRVIKIKTVANN